MSNAVMAETTTNDTVTDPATSQPKPSRISATWRWLDSDYFPEPVEVVVNRPSFVEWDRCISFAVTHLGCLAVIWVGTSWTAVILAVALYFIRMFAITGFYHRYFSHRTFKTSRFMQAIFAIWGLTALQRGPLWWAAHHRHHHRASDQPDDVHSPLQRGFWWSHMGWVTSTPNMPTRYERVPDLAKFPELRFLNRFDWLVPLIMAATLYVAGDWLQAAYPQLGTSGPQLLVWGFFISSVLLFHGTFTINSLAHQWGTRRYDTPDGSRNNLFLALITMGEGWHNNHHQYKASVRQGFFWWEIDITYYLLCVMSWFGLIYDLKPVPDSVYHTNLIRKPTKTVPSLT